MIPRKRARPLGARRGSARARRAACGHLRRIIGEGPGWIDRFKVAVEKGALLPVVALMLLGHANQSEGRAPQ